MVGATFMFAPFFKLIEDYRLKIEDYKHNDEWEMVDPDGNLQWIERCVAY